MSKIKSNLILHIGAPKTGTTSLQYYLRNESRVLRGHGYNPVFMFGNDSRFFAELFATLEPNSHYLKKHNLTSGLRITRHFGRKLPKVILRLATSSIRCRTTIISSEHFSQRISNEAQISDLKRVLDFFFDKILVVFYWREKEGFAKSLYWEALKAGTSLRLEEYSASIPKHLYPNWIIESWSKIFGQENLDVREYTKTVNTAYDFFDEVLRIRPDEYEELGRRTASTRINSSPTVEILETVREFNEKYPDIDKDGNFSRENRINRHKLIESLYK